MKIFIDPGHGGTETGAVNASVKEKNINLIVSKKLKECLIKNGFDVQMAREDDTTVSLDGRVTMANNWDADVYLSVHHNAGGGDGYEVYHSVYGGQGKVLCGFISDVFLSLGQNMRFVGYRRSIADPNKDYYYVIKNTNMPALILEYAFLDTRDFEAVDTVQELETEGEAIAKALVKCYGLEYKEEIPADTESWRYAGLKDLCGTGLVEDYTGWANKINEPLPAWAGFIILNRIYNKLKG